MLTPISAGLIGLRYRAKALIGRGASATVARESGVHVSVAQPARIPLWLIATLAVLAVLVALSIPINRWDAARKRDQWWVSELKAKRGLVQAVVRTGNIEVDGVDAAAIAEIDKENLNAKMAADLSKALDGTPLSNPCNLCRIPVDRVRMQ